MDVPALLTLGGCERHEKEEDYHKFLKFGHPEKIPLLIRKKNQIVICPKDADRKANSVDPDQTALLSGSTLLA